MIDIFKPVESGKDKSNLLLYLEGQIWKRGRERERERKERWRSNSSVRT